MSNWSIKEVPLARLPSLTVEQAKAIASFASHRSFVDSFSDGQTIESATAETLREALVLLGVERETVNVAITMIGAMREESCR